MSYSDDYASPAAPFSGGETGLDSPDLISNSPVTSERVVDTQSGFLVVIKRLESRFALSVKRRIGTPPSSSILLTPDESLKLSKILADQHPQPRDWESRIRQGGMATDVDRWLASFAEHPKSNGKTDASADYENDLDELHDYSKLDQYEAENESNGNRQQVSRWDKFALDEPQYESRRARRSRKKLELNLNLKNLQPKTVKIAAATVAGVVIISAVGAAISSLGSKSQDNKASVLAASPLSEEKVDKFVRAFVSNMLDFGPTSYKVSQISAMAVMAPELLERYWKETNFPLSKRQLSALPQGQTVLITRVVQERADEKTKEVDIYAEFVSADGKMSSPVHLKLKIVSTADGALQVVDQKDLTASGSGHE
ncbi:MAG TPA: hypothetical protein V6D17_00840 [Candidatus Obscuribacterales bacterium]